MRHRAAERTDVSAFAARRPPTAVFSRFPSLSPSLGPLPIAVRVGGFGRTVYGPHHSWAPPRSRRQSGAPSRGRSRNVAMRVWSLVSAAALIARNVQCALPSKDAFLVKGATLPGFSKDVPGLSDSYAGLMPVSREDPGQKMFFWMFPPSKSKQAAEADKRITFWFGGGPGCSGLTALFQQNGPISVPDNKENRTIIKPNPYSFTDFGWTIWLDHPVATGLSVGELDHRDETDVAKEFYLFLQNLHTVFPELKGKEMYFAGESYAGQYIPWLSDHIHNQTDTFDLSGFMVIDGLLAGYEWHKDIPAAEFAVERQTDLQLTKNQVSEITALAQSKGIKDFVANNLHYPPKGKILLPKQYKLDSSLPVWGKLTDLALQSSGCFDAYAIQPSSSFCPPLWPALKRPRNVGDDDFLGPELKKYLHANPDTPWNGCKRQVSVFLHGDASPRVTQSDLLARVIAKSKKAIWIHGADDGWLLPSGTDLILQNYTWNGAQGFTKKPTTPLMVEGVSKGVWQSERGLLYAKVPRAGHEVGKFQPAVAYKFAQYLLGYIDVAQLGK
ncbi:unnamed protein product [Parajaminaea phylloscopi]